MSDIYADGPLTPARKMRLQMEWLIDDLQVKAMELAWNARNRDNELTGWTTDPDEQEFLQGEARVMARVARHALIALVHGDF